MSFALSNGSLSLGKSVQSDVIAARNIRTDALTTNRLTVTNGALTVQEEGVDVLSSSTLNFIGGFVTASDVAGVATVTVATPTIAVQEEGVAVVSASTMNFVGSSVTATDVGGVATITVMASTSTLSAVLTAGSDGTGQAVSNIGALSFDTGAGKGITIGTDANPANTADEYSVAIGRGADSHGTANIAIGNLADA